MAKDPHKGNLKAYCLIKQNSKYNHIAKNLHKANVKVYCLITCATFKV